MKNLGEKKYLKGILKYFVFGVFFFAYSVAWPFTIERPYPPELAPFIPDIEKIVNDILVENSERIDDDPHGIIRKLQALDVILVLDDGRFDRFCDDATQMWTNVNSLLDYIYVCQKTIEVILKYQDQEIYVNVAQQLLHESIHRIGYYDECVTTEIELILMNNSPYADDIHHNDYVDECGLSD